MTKKLTRSVIQCTLCGEKIESKHRHDFVTCKCGNCILDGGLDYQKISGNPKSFNNLSEYKDVVASFEALALSERDTELFINEANKPPHINDVLKKANERAKKIVTNVEVAEKFIEILQERETNMMDSKPAVERHKETLKKKKRELNMLESLIKDISEEEADVAGSKKINVAPMDSAFAEQMRDKLDAEELFKVAKAVEADENQDYKENWKMLRTEIMNDLYDLKIQIAEMTARAETMKTTLTHMDYLEE